MITLLEEGKNWSNISLICGFICAVLNEWTSIGFWFDKDSICCFSTWISVCCLELLFCNSSRSECISSIDLICIVSFEFESVLIISKDLYRVFTFNDNLLNCSSFSFILLSLSIISKDNSLFLLVSSFIASRLCFCSLISLSLFSISALSFILSFWLFWIVIVSFSIMESLSAISLLSSFILSLDTLFDNKFSFCCIKFFIFNSSLSKSVCIKLIFSSFCDNSKATFIFSLFIFSPFSVKVLISIFNSFFSCVNFDIISTFSSIVLFNAFISFCIFSLSFEAPSWGFASTWVWGLFTVGFFLSFSNIFFFNPINSLVLFNRKFFISSIFFSFAFITSSGFDLSSFSFFNTFISFLSSSIFFCNVLYCSLSFSNSSFFSTDLFSLLPTCKISRIEFLLALTLFSFDVLLLACSAWSFSYSILYWLILQVFSMSSFCIDAFSLTNCSFWVFNSFWFLLKELILFRRSRISFL